MKKLMFAAAIAAAAVVAQADCTLGGGSCVPPVWDFQMMLRSDAQCLSVGYSQIDPCSGGGDVCGCYRELMTINYSGVWYICACGCALQNDGTSLKAIVADMTRRIKYTDAEWILAVTDAYRFGAYAGKVAMQGTMSFGTASVLNFVGFGTYPLGTDYFQTLSGYVTGVIDAPGACCTVGGMTNCGVYDLCAPGVIAGNKATWPAKVDKATCMAYGQFQVKFNASASARLAATEDPAGSGNYDLRVIVPSWF